MGQLIGRAGLTFGFIAMFLFCYAAQTLHRNILSPILQAIAAISIPIAGHVFAFVGRADNTIKGWIASGMNHSQRGIVWSVNGLIFAGEVVIGSLALLGLGLYKLSAAVASYRPTWGDHAQQAQISKAVAKAAKATRVEGIRWRRAYAARVAALAASVAAITHALGRTHAFPLDRGKAVEKRVGAHAGRLTRLEKLLGAAGIAAAVAAALGRFGLKRLGCDNVRKNLKNFCKLDSGLLADLISGLAFLGFALSLFEFCQVVQNVAEEVVGDIDYLMFEAVDKAKLPKKLEPLPHTKA